MKDKDRGKDKTKEQLAAELAAAREGEARFRRLLDNMPDVAFRWSVKKGLEYVSPSVKAVTGYSPEELMGEDPMKGLKLAKSKQKDINSRWTKSVTEEGAAPFEEFVFTRKDGTEGYLEVRSVPVMDSKGKLVAAEGILRDVTERRRMEQKLRESEQKFRAVFENVPDEIVRTNAQGVVCMTNPRIYDIFGYRPEEVIGRNVLELDLFATDEVERMSKVMAEIFGKVEATMPRFQLRAKRKDGREFDCEADMVALTGPGGEFDGYVGLLRDITERKKMEQALRESEQRFRETFEHVGDVIYRIDAAGRFDMINDRAFELFGYRPDELVGHTIFELDVFPADEMARMTQLFSDSVAQGATTAPRLDIRAKHKDGHEVLIEVNVSSVVGPDGQFKGFMGVIRDIGERKKFEEALRESERRLKETFEAVPDEIVRINAAGNVEMVNERVYDIFGYRPSELIGRSVFEMPFFPPEELARSSTLLTDSLAKGAGTVPSVEIHAKHRDGHEIDIEVNMTTTLGADGQPNGFTGVVRDITQRKKMEQALADSEARFRRLLSNMPDVIFRWDMQKGLEYVSPSVRVVTGYAPEELMGSDPMKGLKLARAKEKGFNKQWTKAMKEEGAAPFEEFTFVRKDGSEGYLELRSVPVMDDQGNMVAAEGVIRDISQRKKMEEAIRESEARFRRLLDNMPDVVFRWDLQKGLEYVSPSVLNVTGYKPEELMGGDPMTGLKLAASKRETITDEWRKSVTEEGAAPFEEFSFVRKDGSEGYLELRSVPIMDDKGNLVAAEGLIRDVTQRKRMEEELLSHRANLERMVQERTAELSRAQEVVTRQAEEIIEISTPIIQLRRGILLAPLIGTLSTERAQQFTDRLLNRLVQTNSPIALVDITGVPTVDTQTAHFITRTISAVRLLGAQAILTGVGPALATTLVELGIDLSGVITRSALADGLEDATKLLRA